MVETGLVFPVLPGKREALLAFAQAIMGPRKAEAVPTTSPLSLMA